MDAAAAGSPHDSNVAAADGADVLAMLLPPSHDARGGARPQNRRAEGDADAVVDGGCVDNPGEEEDDVRDDDANAVAGEMLSWTRRRCRLRSLLDE